MGVKLGRAVQTFLGLLDTPNSYAGESGKTLVAAITENGLEFVPLAEDIWTRDELTSTISPKNSGDALDLGVGELKVDTILESTPNAGIDLEGLHYQDDYINKSGVLSQGITLDANDNVTMTKDLTVSGSVYVAGEKIQVDQRISTSDAILILNFLEPGTGVTNTYAGLGIDRGSGNPYRIQFNEASDTVRVGEFYTDIAYTNLSGTFQFNEEIKGGTSLAAGYIVSDVGSVLRIKGITGTFQNGETITGQTSGATADINGAPTLTDDTQALATREDTPIDTGVAFWSLSNVRFETDANLTWDGSTLDVGGALEVSGKAFIGSNASVIDFPNAQMVISQADTGLTYSENYGLVSEVHGASGESSGILGVATKVVDVNYAWGVHGIAQTNGAGGVAGIKGTGIVKNTADTGTTQGGIFFAIDTHAGGDNVAVYAQAANGANNYSFLGAGNISNDGNINITTGKTYQINSADILSSPNASSLVCGITGAHSLSGINNTVLGNSAGNTITTGADNTAFGYEACFTNTTANRNTGLGFQALYSNNADDNTAVGYLAGFGVTAGSRSTIMGRSAGFTGCGSNCCLYGFKAGNNLTGYEQTIIGSDAGWSLTTGYQSVLVGYGAGHALTTGVRNVMIGANCGSTATAGNSVLVGYQAGNVLTTNGGCFIGHQSGMNSTAANTAVGYHSLYANTSGSGITAIGYETLEANTTGANNTAFGYQTLKANTTGYDNVAIGTNALLLSVDGHYAIAIGPGALDAHTSASNFIAIGYNAMGLQTGGNYANIAIGTSALLSSTTGGKNIAIGHGALSSVTTSGSNTAVGYRCAENTDSSNNTVFGSEALFTNTSGANNTALGTNALFSNTAGSNSVAIGYQSLYSNTTGNSSVAIGYQTAYNNIGRTLVAIGQQALFNSTTTNGSVAIGYKSAYNITTINDTVSIGNTSLNLATTGAVGAVAVGSYSLQKCNGAGMTAVGMFSGTEGTTATYGTYVGYFAAKANITGSAITAIGYEALQLATASNSTAVGYNAGVALTTGNGDFFGYNAGSDAVTQTNITCIGNSSAIGAHGNDSLVLGNSTQTVYIDGLGGLKVAKNMVIGSGEAGVDYTLTFDGEDNDGVITWLEDEDTFDMSCSLRLNAGNSVNEFSTDGTLAGDSDTALPTEKAVKTYVDSQIAGVDTFLELTDTIGSYNAGRILFETTTTVDDDADLFWDNTNKRLGIGTIIPAVKLDISHSGESIRLSGGAAQTYMTFFNGAARQGYIGTGGSGSAMVLNSDHSLTLQAGGLSNNGIFILSNGNVGVGTQSVTTSTLVNLSSTTGALLITRMTTAQRNALTPINGMIIYNTTDNQFNLYENGSWAVVFTGTSYWQRTGTNLHSLTSGDTVRADGGLTIGIGEAGIDYTLTFDGETNDGVIKWMEDEQIFDFDSSITVNGVLRVTENVGDGDRIAQFFDPTMASGHNLYFQLGQSDTNGNTGEILFNYIGNDDNANAFKLGFHSKDCLSLLNSGDAVFANNLTIGSGAVGVDYTLTFDGETNDGVITWMEDEDTFDMSCNLAVSGDLGVGVSSPAEKLDVYGNVKINNASTTATLWGMKHMSGTFDLFLTGNKTRFDGGARDLYISSNGIVCVNTSTSGARQFNVNGSAGGTTAWFNDSDERLKSNIETIPNALDRVMKLRGVEFEWKDKKDHSEGRQLGFIAQESEDIIPEVVDFEGEYYAMQYAPITAILTEAIKELKIENDKLKKILNM